MQLQAEACCIKSCVGGVAEPLFRGGIGHMHTSVAFSQRRRYKHTHFSRLASLDKSAVRRGSPGCLATSFDVSCIKCSIGMEAAAELLLRFLVSKSIRRRVK